MEKDLIIIALTVCGLFLHFLKKVKEMGKAGTPITLHQYYVKNFDSTIFSVVACAAVLLVLWGSPELTKVTALTIGYVSDSALGAFVKRSGFDVDQN